MGGEGLAVVGGGSMGTRFRPYQPDQMLLLPQDLREWVPGGSPGAPCK